MTPLRFIWTIYLLSGFQNQSHGERTATLTEFNSCRWIIDFSMSRRPNRLWSTYFNEKGSFDVTEKLQDPDITKFLQPTQKGDSEGYFVFPYFLLVRAVCDSGYYDDSYYRIIMHGAYPTIVLSYWPQTARTTMKSALQIISTGALINLEPDEEYAETPQNPNAPHCYLDMCYPAFVVPLVFLQSPIFEVTVESVDEFTKAMVRVHVSPFHARKIEGAQFVEVGSKSEPQPFEYFPEIRIGETDDSTLTKQFLADLVDEPHHPLDSEDFIDPQYTFGSAPIILFSGFYDPDLIIMSDPDLQNIHLMRWGRNPLMGNKSDDNATIFDHGLSCNLQSYYGQNPDYPVPHFTRNDGSLSQEDWPGTYYRTRFKPLKYHSSPSPHAIYEAISMGDRILLVTNSGLVVVYGNSNSTVEADMALKAISSEKLRKCFKIVRVARYAFQSVDSIVAVTYRYIEVKTTTKANSDLAKSSLEQVDQEIWMGELTAPDRGFATYSKAHVFIYEGQAIQWQKLGESQDMDDVEEQQNINIDQEERSGEDEKSMSQPDSICKLAVAKYFEIDKKAIKVEECWVVDASPVNGQIKTIQVMVEMEIFHPRTAEVIASQLNDKLKMATKEAYLSFTIIAQHTPRKSYSKQIWEIKSILPRRPCVDFHTEQVNNLRNYDQKYFHRAKADNEAQEISYFKKHCHYVNRHKIYNDLYLNRMTYTRQSNSQMFLYGNRLVHSNNGGESFAYLRSFPSEQELNLLAEENSEFLKVDKDKRDTAYEKLIKMATNHVIKVMAFSSGGHFAFLTSKRHLFWGSTGTLDQIVLRPSPGYSMIRTHLSDAPGLHDGRPFSLVFDSRDRLFEMVAIVDHEKRITGVRKREVPWALIARNNKFVERLLVHVNKVAEVKADASKNLKNVFSEGNMKFKTYCPYGDAVIYQNYSLTMNPLAHFVIRPPLQHHSLGLALTYTALMAFQASAYSLVHMTFLNRKEESYSHVNKDPFTKWIHARRKEAEIGFFKYFSGDPELSGIIVDPSSFKRLKDDTRSSKQMMPRYYLDYNQVVKIQLSFSVTIKSGIDKTNYKTQKLSLLQLTVDNGNGTILSVETERTINAKIGAGIFDIYLSVNKDAGLKQNLPGGHLSVIPLTFHFIKGFGNCLPGGGQEYRGDSIHTDVYVGCQFGTELQFNSNQSLRSLRFRSPTEWIGMDGDCYEKEPYCFYSKLEVVLYFEIFNAAQQRYAPYNGKYKLRVVAGGYSKDSLEPYSETEQEMYNIPGKSDVSLIWSEWNMQENRKVELKSGDKNDAITGESKSQDNVLTAGVSAIKWTCHTLSPCARVLPSWSFHTVYYFKLRVSNRDMDTETLCLHEKDFIIQLYGFTPSPEVQLLISAACCFFNLLLLYVMYICCRNHRKVWRANKVKMYGWVQVILDTFPKTKEIQSTSKEITEQIRRDEILLSLQGHLGVPTNTKPSKRVEKSKAGLATVSRSSSVTTTDSEVDQEKTLPGVHNRHAASTWTDMIYDQIVTKRVHAIGDRNKEINDMMFKKYQTDASNNSTSVEKKEESASLHGSPKPKE